MCDAASFVRALRDPGLPLPTGLRTRPGADPALRFAVYRNNVAAGWIGALRHNFPALLSIVGDAFFDATAAAYIRASPPRSRQMHLYGGDLPAFLERFAPAADLPYLSDVARLESSRTRAYHAADAPACAAADFADLSPDRLAALRLRLHPSCAILRSDHPVVTIWRMNAGLLEPAPIDSWTGEDALVHRDGEDVRVQRLAPGQAVFIEALQKGAALQDAATHASEAASAFALAPALAVIIGAQLVVALLHQDHAHD